MASGDETKPPAETEYDGDQPVVRSITAADHLAALDTADEGQLRAIATAAIALLHAGIPSNTDAQDHAAAELRNAVNALLP